LERIRNKRCALLTADANNTFKIINALGQTVKTGRFTSRPIQINDLQTGVYILEINIGEDSLLKKFIKR
jgi:LEA14-like dessication related protein